MKDAIDVVPGLAVILVGDTRQERFCNSCPNKKKACESVGIKSFELNMPEDSTEQELLKHISEYNNDLSVHGIIVQLPLPEKEDAVVDVVRSFQDKQILLSQQLAKLTWSEAVG